MMLLGIDMGFWQMVCALWDIARPYLIGAVVALVLGWFVLGAWFDGAFDRLGERLRKSWRG